MGRSPTDTGDPAFSSDLKLMRYFLRKHLLLSEAVDRLADKEGMHNEQSVQSCGEPYFGCYPVGFPHAWAGVASIRQAAVEDSQARRRCRARHRDVRDDQPAVNWECYRRQPEALTLEVRGHDEQANRARAELADALLAEKDRSIFPAHAGVIRSSTKSGNRRKSLPRACGGDPYIMDEAVLPLLSSPRMRG